MAYAYIYRDGEGALASLRGGLSDTIVTTLDCLFLQIPDVNGAKEPIPSHTSLELVLEYFHIKPIRVKGVLNWYCVTLLHLLEPQYTPVTRARR